MKKVNDRYTRELFQNGTFYLTWDHFKRSQNWLATNYIEQFSDSRYNNAGKIYNKFGWVLSKVTYQKAFQKRGKNFFCEKCTSSMQICELTYVTGIKIGLKSLLSREGRCSLNAIAIWKEPEMLLFAENTFIFWNKVRQSFVKIRNLLTKLFFARSIWVVNENVLRFDVNLFFLWPGFDSFFSYISFIITLISNCCTTVNCFFSILSDLQSKWPIGCPHNSTTVSGISDRCFEYIDIASFMVEADRVCREE